MDGLRLPNAGDHVISGDGIANIFDGANGNDILLGRGGPTLQAGDFELK